MGAVRILVVDDEPAGRHALAELLRDEGYEVAEAESGKQALRRLETFRAKVIVTDYKMPGMSGLELVERVRRAFGKIAAVLVSAYGPETRPRSGNDEVPCLEKPLAVDTLLRTIRRAVAGAV